MSAAPKFAPPPTVAGLGAPENPLGGAGKGAFGGDVPPVAPTDIKGLRFLGAG